MKKIGALYQVKAGWWMVFPNKETAVHTGLSFGLVAPCWPSCSGLMAEAAYYSMRFNCNVSYISPNDIVVLLEIDGKFKKVLTSNGELRWTWFFEEYNDSFEEVSQ